MKISLNKPSWTISKARAKFGQVVRKAASNGPQSITRNGIVIAFVVAAEKRKRKKIRKGTLADFFAASPLRNSGIQIKRLPGRLHLINFQ